ncbi:MAG: Ig-like domain-containing protein [Bacteroidales bacterium]|nr:Ig-like domain-containing protein [Bacteroidales bacterium]
MRIRTFIYGITAIGLSALLCRCAHIGNITGGSKDTTPPQILSQHPEDYSTRFHDKEIKITFDEFVELVSPESNFLISPPLDENPQYHLKGKTLVIDFKACNLDSNTTYIVLCDHAVKDYTEGNMLPAKNIVFSTGDYIDTMCLCGTIKDAFTMDAVKGAYVILHTEDQDSALCTLTPRYICKTDAKGQYMFVNIADRPYYISALTDKNQNLKYDQSDEQIAFQKQMVMPYPMPALPAADTLSGDSTALVDSLSSAGMENKSDTITTPAPALDSCHLLMFTQTDTTVKFLKKELLALYHYQLIFRNKAESFLLRQISNTDTLPGIQTEMVPTRDTVHVFFTDTINETFEFQIEINGIPTDTIELNPGQKPPGSRLTKKSDDDKKYVSTGIARQGTLFQHLILKFGYPVQVRKEHQMRMIVPKDTVKDTIYVDSHFTDSLQRYLEIDFDFSQEKTAYTLLCPDSVFYTAYGWTNDSIAITVNTAAIKDFGDVNLYYNFYATNTYIVELLNEKRQIVQSDTITYNKKISYLHLTPGKYTARVIIDENSNGRWDSGKYVERIQPEKVIYYPGWIEAKANWTIEETFDVVTEEKQ